MFIALFAAIRQEATPTFAHLGLTPRGDRWTNASATIQGTITGVGRDRVRIALDRLLEKEKPTHLINFGFAGGLDPNLRVGDILRVDRLAHDTGETLQLRPDAPPSGTNDPLPPTLVTVDRLIDSPRAKRELFTRTGALGVDMETYHLAVLARDRGIIFHALRVISDPADFALPADAARWITPPGGLNVPGLARSLILSPWIIPTLMKLGRHAAAANAALGPAVAECVRGIEAR